METTGAPDLTMLAMAAYNAIRRDMEDTHEKKEAHRKGEPDQPSDRLRDRAPGRPGTRSQRKATSDCRFIAI